MSPQRIVISEKWTGTKTDAECGGHDWSVTGTVVGAFTTEFCQCKRCGMTTTTVSVERDER